MGSSKPFTLRQRAFLTFLPSLVLLLGVGIASKALPRQLLVAAFALAVLLARNMIRSLLAPIKGLTASAIAVSEGRLKPQVNYAARDELGELVDAFNHMVEQLAVSRRTAELRSAELEESELNLRRAQEIAHLGSWHLDVAADRLTWSDEVFRIFGVPLGTALSYETFISRVHPDDRARVDEAWKEAMRGGPYDIEHRILVPDGEGEGAPDATRSKWVRERALVTFDAGGNAIEGVGTVQDITERRQAEAKLHKLNRALRALSASNHALVRARDELAWMTEICRLIVEEAGYRLCWVGRAEDDDDKTVRPIAGAGVDDGYIAALRITWADAERGRGPTGTCIRSGRPVLVRDVAQDPMLAPWRTEALRRGFASCVAIPIIVEGKPFGALSIYAAEPDAFGAAEMALAGELADDLGYGITVLRTRAERDRALGELRALNAELEARVAHRTAEVQAVRAREATVAAKIQQQLLLDETPHDVPGLKISVLTLPSQGISGDFCAFFRHEDVDCLDVLVADVMGKGVPAALLGAATKSQFPEALRRLMASGVELPEPNEIVTLVHSHVARQLIDIESFVTLCYARIDVAARRLSLVDCGHTGVLQVNSRTAACRLLRGNDVPLGTRETELYEQLSVPLDPEDVLVFFSDGVTEARNAAGELYGVERLIACVVERVSAPPRLIVEAIRESVAAFAGVAKLADDLTCVAVKLVQYEAPLARARLRIRSALAELCRAREFVESFCRTLPGGALAAEPTAALTLAVNEAASNIIKHGCRGRDDQRIDLNAEVFHDRVSIRLRYVGNIFEPALVAAPAFDGSRESGFGVFMINRSVDTVRYYSDDLRRSCIRLEKLRVASAVPAPPDAQVSLTPDT